MKRIIFVLLFVFAIPFFLKAQWVSVRNNLVDSTVDYYVTGTGARFKTIYRIKDSTYIRIYNPTFQINSLNYSKNDGTPNNILWTSDSGIVRRSPISSLGFITTEIDPTVPSYVKAITSTNISNWNTAFGWGNHASAGYALQTNVYTKTQGDARYLQSFTETDPTAVHTSDSSTMLNPYLRKLDANDLYQLKGSYLTSETDPIWTSVSGNYYTKTQGDTRYLQSYTETDPIYVAGIANYFNKTQSDARYLQSYNETDPLSIHIADSATMLTPYLRKTDATSTYQLKGSYLTTEIDPLSVHITDSASMLLPYLRKIDTTGKWQQVGNYLTSISSAQINAALGYAPVNPNGTALQYIKGDGTTATFPTTVSSFTNDAGYLTSITGTQVNTSLGYTAYNGTTNSSGFLTSVSSSNVTTALGYTPVTNARTLTINGTTQDLTTNRTWSVGDILSTGSYANPSWITSLAWSKITGTPTTLSDYGITDGVTLSSLTTTLGSYATTSALTTGLSGKEPTISAGISGQYWRYDKTWATLNTSVVPESGNLYYTDTRARTAISLTTTGSSGAATYNTTTGVLNIPQYSTPTFSNTPSRSLNTGFQLSTTKNTRVSYTITITTAISLLNLNSSGTVYLEISPDNSTWTTINSAGITRTLSVGLTLSITDASSYNVAGEIPVGYYCRLRSSLSGGATAAFTSGQEVTY